MLSAVKLCQSSSISGPVATEKPRSAKISASSSITWLTGWTEPLGAAGAGKVRSRLSVARRASSSASSSTALRAAIASAAALRRLLSKGPCTCRSSGDILPSVFINPEIDPCLPRNSIRSASSAAASGAFSIRVSASVLSWSRSVIMSAWNYRDSVHRAPSPMWRNAKAQFRAGRAVRGGTAPASPRRRSCSTHSPQP